MNAVDLVIRAKLQSDVPLVNQIGEYIISAGGKRIRPTLAVLVANAHGYQGTKHHDLAEIIEFIHTATLLHDDVVDESSMRRGRKTANAMFGNAASVLVGDFLYTRSFQMMVGLQDMRVMEILADATNIIAEGEVLQLLNMHDPDVTEERYLQVIRSKTDRSSCGIRTFAWHGIPAHRRRAGLFRQRGRHRQKRGRRFTRRKNDAAVNLPHAKRNARTTRTRSH